MVEERVCSVVAERGPAGSPTWRLVKASEPLVRCVRCAHAVIDGPAVTCGLERGALFGREVGPLGFCSEGVPRDGGKEGA